MSDQRTDSFAFPESYDVGPELEIRAIPGDDTNAVVVGVSGEIDLLTNALFQATLRGHLERLAGRYGAALVADLAGVRLCAACGCGTLAQAAIVARDLGVRFSVRGCSSHLLRIFTMLRLDRVLDATA
jgi:anti-anti-sigma factor